MDIPFPGGPLDDTTGTGLFRPCVGPETNSTTAVILPRQCADNTLCVRNFFFFFASLSYQVCLCPMTTVPTSPPGSGCTPIQGSACTSNVDCSFRPYDCVGLTNWNIDTTLKDFLTPLVFYICSNTIEFRVVIPNYACVANVCVFVGLSSGIPTGIPGVPGFGRKKRDLDDLRRNQDAGDVDPTKVWLRALETSGQEALSVQGEESKSDAKLEVKQTSVSVSTGSGSNEECVTSSMMNIFTELIVGNYPMFQLQCTTPLP
ncbi:uncharacterized protein LOC106178340 [Lingula anatina]|uniref:Uncharacterized protein LOC106178340 n=1 Tax=Lingula anatina TaxID=7574 RepID=A0A1S3K2R3_LINAN|nr:uncharacterized protein LOC106178340 [Lingula anatina]|eukprot:XP_013416930.1 uncharacterized protein LOC106178340 [Lingula anatina]